VIRRLSFTLTWAALTAIAVGFGFLAGYRWAERLATGWGLL
jgi:hypothetical protein